MDRRQKPEGQGIPTRIVGFHVEGQASTPSPPGSSVLQAAEARKIAGSPTAPVIIPPQLKRDAPPAKAPEAQRPLDFSGAPQQPGAAGGSQAAAGPAAAAAPAPKAPGGGAPAASSPKGTSGKPPLSGGGAGGAPAAPDGASRQASSSGGGADARQREQRAPPAADGGEDKKPTTRAERRAIQEASRAAKAARLAAAGGGGGGGGGSGGGGGAQGGSSGGGAPPAAGGKGSGGGDRAASRPASAAGAAPAPAPDAAAGAAAPAPPGGRAAAAGGEPRRGGGKGAKHAAGSSTELFAHLQQYRRVTVEVVLQAKNDAAGQHPAIVALALQYADGSISGGMARCVAMVHALAQLITDYRTPPGKSLPRDLMAQVNAAVDFLVRCRPLGVSMGNAIKFIKLCISKIDPNAPEAAAKADLLKQLGDFIQEKVVLADQVLVSNTVSKIETGDVIMTYSFSQVVLEVLLRAHAEGKRFRVVVVDSRPECEGRRLLRRLLDANMACTYTLLSGLSYAIKEVTKLVLGAAAVLSNGTVMSRAGSALVATMASAAGKPVLVCCETLKFHERVQLDSITHNELGDPGALARLPPGASLGGDDQGVADGGGGASPPLAGWESVPRLGLLNLKYDAMPAEYVSVVVCEFGMIPPSSVPVILREWGAKMEEGA